MSRFLVLDTETIPCLEMARRVWGIDPESPGAFEAIGEARRTETDGKGDTSFPKPFMHRIVGIGMVGLDLAKGTVSVVSAAGEDESEYLRRFHLMLAGRPVLVTWNGLGFDLPVIRYRALFHALPLPQLYGATLRGYDRYDYRFGEQHFDLMDILSGFGRSPTLKLSEMAALCDVPCKSQGSSDQVLGWFRAGDFPKIDFHVQEDAQATARIFLNWWASRGSAPWDALAPLDEQLASMVAV